MSSTQNINRKALAFSEQMKRRSASAHRWARNLKIKAAAANLAIMAISAFPWLIGRIFYWGKWLMGILIFAFRNGARSDG